MPRRMPTRRRNRSTGRHLNSPTDTEPRNLSGTSSSRGRSSSRGKFNKKMNDKNNDVPLAVLLKPVIGKKSLTHKNYLLQKLYKNATEIRTPGGTVVANYRKKLSPEYLTEYPYPNSNSESYNSEESQNEPTLEEMRRDARIAYVTTMINNPLQPVRPRSANRPEYNFGAYRRGRNPLGRRESF